MKVNTSKSKRESDFGAIYYYEHEFECGEDPKEHATCLAKSLTIFINSLTEYSMEGSDDEE